LKLFFCSSELIAAVVVTIAAYCWCRGGEKLLRVSVNYPGHAGESPQQRKTQSESFIC